MAATWIETLADHGVVVIDDFIKAELTSQLLNEATQLPMQAARIGRAEQSTRDTDIRGDHTRWFEAESASAPQRQLLDHFAQLQEHVNRELFAGLVDVQCHYAHYPPGARYDLHRDRFRDDDRRVLSCVVYLNADWLPEHGGDLRLYRDDGSHLMDIEPVAGRAVLFRSEQFPHEVLPATRNRYSVAAWFYRRG
jgi:SM-20-related protein